MASPVLIPSDARALIFDCDGTLVHSAPLYGRAWTQAAELSGVSMSLDWYRARAGMSEDVLLDAFEALHGVALDRHAIVARMRDLYFASLADIREIEMIASIAREGFGRLPMAVASGGPETIVQATLRATGLFGLFDTVVTRDDVERPKPAPDLFLEAARRMGVSASDCLVFEDSPEGLEAAARAGMRAIDVVALIGSGGA